jgi:hypothetical protein
MLKLCFRSRPEDLHRPPLSIPIEKLIDILCHREQRYVGSQLTLSYDRKRIILERNSLSEGLVGKYVDVYGFPDDRLEVRTKGLLLPYCGSSAAPFLLARHTCQSSGVRIAVVILVAHSAIATEVARWQSQPGVLPFSTNEYGVDLATGNVNIVFPLNLRSTFSIPVLSISFLFSGRVCALAENPVYKFTAKQ